MRPLFSDRDGTWGPAGDFQVARPTLFGPSGPVATPSPAFNWTTVDGATRYVLVLTDLTTGKRAAVVRTTDTHWTPTTPLVNGHVYRWTVAARNESGFGLFATALDFRVTL